MDTDIPVLIHDYRWDYSAVSVDADATASAKATQD